MTWTELIVDLQKCVNWRSARYIDSECRTVEEILRRHLADRSIVTERTDEILQDNQLFSRFAPHCNYPRTPMDKFILHMEHEDLFRVRLHRFWPQETAGGAVEKVHYHKWDMTTFMLSGQYREERYDYDTAIPDRDPTLVESCVLPTGCARSLSMGVPHRVVNESKQEPAMTFFVRGPDKLAAARIFDLDSHCYWDTYDPLRQMREGYRAAGTLDPYFHPVLRPGERRR